MYERVLVPLDGSETAEVVLPYVRELARKLGAKLDIISVFSESECSSEHLFKTYLDKITAVLESSGISTSPVLFYGSDAAEVILSYVNKNKTNLIAMATRGRSGISRWVIGSVAEKVLRGTPIPILLISTKVSEIIPPEKARFKRILVPLDGSDLGAKALPWVEELAKKTDAKLFLLHVSLPAYKFTGVRELGLGYPEQLAEAVRVAAKDYINGVATDLDKKKIAVQYEIVYGTPAEAILAYAKGNNIDLIAMSTHGRTGVSRWVFGSVADKLLHAIEPPILMVRSLPVVQPK